MLPDPGNPRLHMLAGEEFCSLKINLSSFSTNHKVYKHLDIFSPDACVWE